MSDEIKNPNTEEEYQPDLMTLEAAIAIAYLFFV